MWAPSVEPLLEGFRCQVSGFREEGAVNPDDDNNYLSNVNQSRSLFADTLRDLIGICFKINILRCFP